MNSLFTRENFYHFLKELLWQCITALIAAAVLYPIVQKLDYLYLGMNIFFIFLSITYFRWTLTFRSLPFLRPSVVRFVLFAVNMSLFIYLLAQENKYLSYFNNFYTEDFGFPKVIIYDEDKTELFRYLYTELIFFATASLTMICAFNVRLLVSWWQYYKHESDTQLQD